MRDALAGSRARWAAAVLSLAVVGPLSGCARTPEPAPERPRVLVFSKTAGYRHVSIEPGIEAIRSIGRAEGFDVDATEDAAVFESPDLARYGAVVFLSTTGDVLTDAQQRAFTAWFRNGGALVGVHAASDTEYDWPWFGRLVGGYFARHPNDPNVREGVVLVSDHDHPSTAALPDPWVREDEWYEFGDLVPGLNVLLDVDETSYKRPDESPAAAPRPIAWYHDFEGGRAWYTGLGHTTASFAEAAFLEHLRGGLEYALGGGG